jgi:hypothetical protein
MAAADMARGKTAAAEQAPWQAEWPDHLDDPIAEDVALQHRIEQSEFWRLLQRALSEVREQVLQTTVLTNEQLWRREGAIGQLTYLLHHTPVLVVWQHRKDTENAG